MFFDVFVCIIVLGAIHGLIFAPVVMSILMAMGGDAGAMSGAVGLPVGSDSSDAGAIATAGTQAGPVVEGDYAPRASDRKSMSHIELARPGATDGCESDGAPTAKSKVDRTK